MTQSRMDPWQMSDPELSPTPYCSTPSTIRKSQESKKTMTIISRASHSEEEKSQA